MIRKILVPLDGSKLAECALPYVEELVEKGVAKEVTLISVTERIQGFRVVEDPGAPLEESLSPEAVGKMERQATKYLDRIAKSLEAKGAKVGKEVLLGDPAEEIIIYAKIKSCDLIIMASHGRSGPSRWAHGSVADRVFRAVCTPPYGFNLFVMRAVTPKDITMGDIYRSVVPFVLLQALGLAIVVIFPQIALWLPNMMVLGK